MIEDREKDTKVIEEEPKDEEPKERKGSRKAAEKEPVLMLPDGTAVAAPGLGIHQIRDGKRHWVPDTWTQAKLGIRMDEVVMLFPEQLMSIPEGAPIPSKAPDEPLF